MKRLFTVGCSFTRYHWPTYADILGREFDEFQNWGNSGLGNRAIVERLTELVIHNKITKDDVIIIQWTSPHRFDAHLPHRFPLDGWFTGGNMLNSPLFPDDWLNTYWNEFSYVMHTMNFISLATKLCETLPCQWFMTSMNSFDDDFFRFPNLEEYENYLKEVDWLPPMQDFFKESGIPEKPFKKNVRDNHGRIVKTVDVWDPHPSPIVHYEYANNFIKNELNINLDYDWAKKADDLLSSNLTHDEVKDLYIKELNWDNSKNWKRGL